MKPTLSLMVASSLILLSACSFSDETATSAPATQSSAEPAMVPALIFVQYLNQQAPTLLCQQDAGIQCLAMPAELCVAAVQKSAERCGPALLEQWPASFAESEENAIKYANEYRQCILADWVAEFGLEAERLSACGLTVN